MARPAPALPPRVHRGLPSSPAVVNALPLDDLGILLKQAGKMHGDLSRSISGLCNKKYFSYHYYCCWSPSQDAGQGAAVSIVIIAKALYLISIHGFLPINPPPMSPPWRPPAVPTTNMHGRTDLLTYPSSAWILLLHSSIPPRPVQ